MKGECDDEGGGGGDDGVGVRLGDYDFGQLDVRETGGLRCACYLARNEPPCCAHVARFSSLCAPDSLHTRALWRYCKTHCYSL